jgi:hypothetical protein
MKKKGKKVEMHERDFKLINLFRSKYPDILRYENGDLVIHIKDKNKVTINPKDIELIGGIEEFILEGDGATICFHDDARPLVGEEVAAAAAAE